MKTCCKPSLRRLCRKNRISISAARREESIQLALQRLMPLFGDHPFVLSYAGFADEFDTDQINKRLCATGQLVLPKIEGNSLQIFHVDNIEKQTEKNRWGISEPLSHCRKADPAHVSLALVPGLAFDEAGHRLGYGKGFYDRFLPIISQVATIIGIGFKEQLMKDFIPVADHDFRLHETLLF